MFFAISKPITLLFISDSSFFRCFSKVHYDTVGGRGVHIINLHIYLAAEKISPMTVKKCWEIFSLLALPQQQIHIGYGMAENTLGCACTKTPFISISSFLITEQKDLIPVTPNTQGSIELVSIGQANSHHDITVRDTKGVVLPELKLGEIYIKSPCVSPGYFNNPALSALAFPEGCFRSSDLGFSYQGELYFYARLDDMLIIGGRNIIPQDIEECAENLNFVRPTTSCLVAKENKLTGASELMLIIEANVHTDPEVLKQQALSVQKQVITQHDLLLKQVIFCKKGAVEKTSSGKKRRKIIRERLLNNQLEVLGVDYA